VRLYLIVALTALCLALQAYSGFAQEQTTAVTDSIAPEKQEKGTTATDREKEEKAKAEQPYTIEPVVVTATRTETPLSEVTKSVYVVDKKEMETQQQTSIPEALDIVPGVMVQNQGGPGQYSAVNIRGASSEYVQFQYNGFPLRDAADTQTTFQFLESDLFGQSGINRIEVLNGTNSVLYGSQAIGGVVNIIPQKWQNGFSAELMSEAGSHNTFIENGGFAYGQKDYYINFYPMYITTDGISNGGPNSYWYNNVGFTGGAGIRFGNNMALEVCNITSSSDLALTSAATYPSLNAQHQLIPNQASPTDHAQSLFNLTGLTFSQQVSSIWDYSIKGAYGTTERRFFEPDYNYGAPGSADFGGTTSYIEMQHNVHATDWLTLTGGFDYDGATYFNRVPTVQSYTWTGSYQSYNEDWFGYDLFGQAQMAFFDKSLFFTGGLRFNDHEDFASKVVEEVSAAYIFKKTGTKIHTAFGTGYRTPSLYEIYGGAVNPAGNMVTIGNPKLRPEESTSYDVGVTQNFLNNKLNMGITWFHIDFDNLIIFNDFAYQYQNANVAKTEGIEAKLEAKPCKYFSLTAAYTYANSQYATNNSIDWTRLEYWPMDTFSFIGTVYPIERLSISFKVLWEGDRIVPLYDPSFKEVRWIEPGDIRLDMITTYKILKNYKHIHDIDIFMKITNLLDEHYTESGFQMPGRWIYGGVKMAF
jgi:vitamin B12 transporter